MASEERDSGWEDNNIFQSGAESSSPIRPSPVRSRTRRSSAAPRSRKSTSAPPEYALAPKGKEKEKPVQGRASSVRPPESSFEPELPPALVKQSRRVGTRSRGPSMQPEELPHMNVVVIPDVVEEVEEPPSQESVATEPAVAEVTQVVEEAHQIVEAEDLEDIDEDADADEESGVEEDEHVVAVSKKLAADGQVVPHRVKAVSTPWYLRILITTLLLLGSSVVYDYKKDSASIGFCETGKATNDILEGLRVRWAAVETCNRENRTTLFPMPEPHNTESVLPPEPSQAPEASSEYSGDTNQDSQVELCPPLSLIPFHPDSCAPCPPHASCSPSRMTCENGYIIHPHPLLFFLPLPPSPSPTHSNAQNSYSLPSHSDNFAPSSGTIPQLVSKYVAYLLDGLPGLGPVALSPRCLEDPRRERLIGALGKGVDYILAEQRGQRLCAGIGAGEPAGTEAEEAKKWGMEVGVLKDDLKKKISVRVLL